MFKPILSILISGIGFSQILLPPETSSHSQKQLSVITNLTQPPTSIVWLVRAGNPPCPTNGTISPTGLFTAPSTTSACNVIVTAGINGGPSPLRYDLTITINPSTSGPPGPPGQSPTILPEPTSSNCPFAGIRIIDSLGDINFICNGSPGPPGPQPPEPTVQPGLGLLMSINMGLNNDVTYKLFADTSFILMRVGIPTLSSSNCVEDTWAMDSNYFYLCITPNTWRRIPHGTW